MTDKFWNELAPDFSKGICDIPVIKDYPELWMVLTLDGYGSHLQGDALKIFADYKILIVKEEGDTSKVCQAYDKDVSLSDKGHHRHFLNGIRISVNTVDQYALIIVANKVCNLCVLFYLSVANYYINMPLFDCQIAQALNKLRKKTWGDSHHILKLHPSTRVPFDDYIERVKDVVDAGDFLYINCYGKFYAMPAFWKHLDEQQRRDVAALIGSFYDNSKADCSKEPWALPKIKKFLNIGYVKLYELAKFRVDYL